MRPSGCVLPAAGEIKFRVVIKSLLNVPLAGTHIVSVSGVRICGQETDRESWSVRTG